MNNTPKTEAEYEAEFDALFEKALRMVIIEEQRALDAEVAALAAQGLLPKCPSEEEIRKIFEKYQKTS